MDETSGIICQATLQTIVGPVVIIADQKEIHSITFIQETKNITGIQVGNEHDSAILHDALNQLRGYFAGTRQRFEMPLRYTGTVFQNRVWQQIAAIPYGKVRTYGDIGARLGNPNLARAVGQAANRNPQPIVVPCHRVIGASGWVGGFAPGVDLKKILLRHEGFL